MTADLGTDAQYVGMYLDWQRSSTGTLLPSGAFDPSGDSNFLRDIRQLTADDTGTTSADTAVLKSLPGGKTVRVKVRIGHEDVMNPGGYVWGPWSNTISDAIPVVYSAHARPNADSPEHRPVLRPADDDDPAGVGQHVHDLGADSGAHSRHWRGRDDADQPFKTIAIWA